MQSNNGKAIVHDPFNSWDAFDRLFDEAFAPKQHQPVVDDWGSPQSHGYSSPGLYSSSYGSSDVAEEALNRVWDDAMRRSKKSSTITSTRRRDETPGPSSVAGPSKPKLKRRASRVHFHEAPNGKTITATFDLPGVPKDAVHISYQTDRLVVTWQTVSTTERKEGDRLVRERREKKYSRTLPLPEGTRFEQIRATMDSNGGRHLTITYPKWITVPTPDS